MYLSHQIVSTKHSKNNKGCFPFPQWHHLLGEIKGLLDRVLFLKVMITIPPCPGLSPVPITSAYHTLCSSSR